MKTTVSDIIEGYNDLMINKRDPRLDGWLFMSSPWPTVGICVSYVYIVKRLGPKLMQNRPPFHLKYLLVVYNFFQVLVSAYLFYEYCVSGWLNGYSYRCQPVDYSNSELAVRMVHACYWYYISKYLEFFDTFFFILRKKYEHVSTLHVIHHGIMPFSVWLGLKFTPGGHSTFFGLLNAFVHIIMYFYYMVSAMGPQYQKYLWWKKYLTSLQMVQFVAVVSHAFQLLFIECDYPKVFVYWIGGHAIMFFALFSDFYRKAYLARSKAKAKAKASASKLATSDKKLLSNGHARKLSDLAHVNGFIKKLENGDISNGHSKNGYIHHDDGDTIAVDPKFGGGDLEVDSVRQRRSERSQQTEEECRSRGVVDRD